MIIKLSIVWALCPALVIYVWTSKLKKKSKKVNSKKVLILKTIIFYIVYAYVFLRVYYFLTEKR